MVRWVMVLVMLLTVMTVPVWAQGEGSQFAKLPPCETEVLEAYAEEILPDIYTTIARIVDASAEGPLDLYYVTGFTPSPLMPPCREALKLRDEALSMLHGTMVARALVYGGFVDLGEAVFESWIGSDFTSIMGLVPDYHQDREINLAGGTSARLTVNDPLWDAADGEEELVAMVVSDYANCYRYIEWGRDNDDGLARRMKWRQDFINKCI